jgi:hypothetical protein
VTRRLFLTGLACCGRLSFDPMSHPVDGSNAAVMPALVQTQAETATGSTAGLPIEPTQAGSLLVMMVSSDVGQVPVDAISDDAGNVYTSANVLAATPGLAADAEIWYAAASKPGGTVVSVTGSASTTRDVWFAEIGAATLVLDRAAPQDDGMQTTADVHGPSITPARTPALIVTMVVVNANISSLVAPSQFIGLPVEHGDDAAYALVDAAGTYSATWDASGSGPYCGAIASFTVP